VPLLAREAIVADIADRSLDARLVLGPAHTRGVDEEATCLRIFAEAFADPRLWRPRPSCCRSENQEKGLCAGES
jgi:hypothetical protein